jgi:hypothetical protein
MDDDDDDEDDDEEELPEASAPKKKSERQLELELGDDYKIGNEQCNRKLKNNYHLNTELVWYSNGPNC